MRRIFTHFIILTCLLYSSQSFGQCLTGGSFIAGSTHDFNSSTEGFTGDFAWTPTSSGQLESTPVSAGSQKTLTTATYIMPNSGTTVAWSFNLGGTANVENYTVEAQYLDNSNNIVTVPVCTGANLSTTGSNLIFAAAAPSAIVGKMFRLVFTFTSSSTGSKVLTMDNFAINVNASQIVLPVTFTYITAAAATGGIKITWMVASEYNVNVYQIERSSNGKQFTKIGQVNATGGSSYSYIDMSYNTGSNYYRIKAVDNDLSSKYSSIVLYKVGKKGIQLKAYPMPVQSDLTLHHEIAEKNAQISIISVEGRVLKTVVPVEGVQQTDINLSTLTPGLYIVRFDNGNGVIETAKIVKQ